MSVLSQKIQSLVNDRDSRGLIRILSSGSDSYLRIQAAQGLGLLGDIKTTEALVRSALSDTDETVRSAALSSLENMLGTHVAKQAIDSYGDVEEMEPEENDFQEPISPFSDRSCNLIANLAADEDTLGLSQILGSHPDPALRVMAAAELGKIGAIEFTETLIKSALGDPEESVRKQSITALETYLGKEVVRYALDSYGDVEPNEALLSSTSITGSEKTIEKDKESEEETDILDEQDDAFPEVEVGFTRVSGPWEPEDLPGLVMVLREESDPAMQLKAIEALRHFSHMSAIDALSSSAIWSDHADVRTASRNALKVVYGDDVDTELNKFKQNFPDYEEYIEDEKTETGDETQENTLESAKTHLNFSETNQPSVFEEDKHSNTIFKIILGVILFTTAVYFLFLR